MNKKNNYNSIKTNDINIIKLNKWQNEFINKILNEKYRMIHIAGPPRVGKDWISIFLIVFMSLVNFYKNKKLQKIKVIGHNQQAANEQLNHFMHMFKLLDTKILKLKETHIETPFCLVQAITGSGKPKVGFDADFLLITECDRIKDYLQKLKTHWIPRMLATKGTIFATSTPEIGSIQIVSDVFNIIKTFTYYIESYEGCNHIDNELLSVIASAEKNIYTDYNKIITSDIRCIPLINSSPTMASIDVGGINTDTAIVLYDYKDDKYLVHEIVTIKGNFTDQLQKVLSLLIKNKINKVIIDSTSFCKIFADNIAKFISHVTHFVFNKNNKQETLLQLYNLIKQQKIIFSINIKEMNKTIQQLSYVYYSNRNIIIEGNDNYDIVTALSLMPYIIEVKAANNYSGLKKLSNLF